MISGEKSFGALLRELRAAAGLSQEELAERAGLSRRGISDLERGSRRSPHPTTLRRLAEGLRLGPAQHSALLAAAHQHGFAGRDAIDKLPTPVSTFVGRAREVAEVSGLLTSTRPANADRGGRYWKDTPRHRSCHSTQVRGI
jgi:transcriptional regulator with XRE-family HTH domain